jgi:hypothetical protein
MTLRGVAILLAGACLGVISFRFISTLPKDRSPILVSEQMPTPPAEQIPTLPECFHGWQPVFPLPLFSNHDTCTRVGLEEIRSPPPRPRIFPE